MSTLLIFGYVLNRKVEMYLDRFREKEKRPLHFTMANVLRFASLRFDASEVFSFDFSNFLQGMWIFQYLSCQLSASLIRTVVVNVQLPEVASTTDSYVCFKPVNSSLICWRVCFEVPLLSKLAGILCCIPFVLQKKASSPKRNVIRASTVLRESFL